MKTLFTLFALFFPFSAQAQNYQCLQSGVKRYFTNDNGYVRGIRVDSVRTSGTSTMYYPFHTPRGYYNPSGIGSALLDSNGGSWLGKKVIQQVDGTFLFDNLWHDTVVIKTQSNVGDTWIFYRDTTSLYYQADLISVDTMTVTGSIDSVKKILITAHNSTAIVTTDPVDSFQIILSKNNGFVQIFDLFTFPYHAPDSVYRYGLDYYLDHIIQLTGPFPRSLNSIFSLINFINPTFAQLYQWDIGDIYEYSVCNDYFEHFGTGCDPVERYYIDTVTSVNVSTGSTSYHINGMLSTYVSPWPVTPYGPYGLPVYSNSANNGVITYDSVLLFDTTLMPEEFGQTTFWGYSPNDNSHCITNTLYSLQDNIEIIGAEYLPPFENLEDPSLYKSPLGLLSKNKEQADAPGNDVYSQKLIYYEHDGYSCDAILIPPTLVYNNSLLNNSIIIFPNPATNELTIKTNYTSTYTISIFNVLGQAVQTIQTDKQQEIINVSNIPDGVYNISISNENSERINNKVVIVH